LPPKAFAVLHYLVTHPDRLITKDELLTPSGRHRVSDAVVRVAIGALRRCWRYGADALLHCHVPRRGIAFCTVEK